MMYEKTKFILIGYWFVVSLVSAGYAGKRIESPSILEICDVSI